MASITQSHHCSLRGQRLENRTTGPQMSQGKPQGYGFRSPVTSKQKGDVALRVEGSAEGSMTCQDHWNESREDVHFPTLGVFDPRQDALGIDMQSTQNLHLKHWTRGILEYDPP